MLITFFCIFLPLLMSALIHHLVIVPMRLFTHLTFPIDGNMQFAGHQLFGPSKTARGLVVMTLGTAFFATLLSFILPPEKSYLLHPPYFVGLIIGFSYAIGELPTSFIKRQLELPASQQRHDFIGILLYMLEQSDSILAVLFSSLFLVNLKAVSPAIIVLSGGIGILTHLIIDLLLHWRGYKKNAAKPFFWKG